jgi:hypothetical protein
MARISLKENKKSYKFPGTISESLKNQVKSTALYASDFNVTGLM